MKWILTRLFRRRRLDEPKRPVDVRLPRDVRTAAETSVGDRVARLDLTRVVLRGGLGQIRFGMTEQQVTQLLGPASERRTDEHGGAVLSYYDPSMDLDFADVPNRGPCLVTIRVINSNLFLRGVPLIESDEMQTADALIAFGVTCYGKQRYDTALHGLWSMRFSHGLEFSGWKGPTDTVSWTILPESGQTADIDWSGRDCVG